MKDKKIPIWNTAWTNADRSIALASVDSVKGSVMDMELQVWISVGDSVSSSIKSSVVKSKKSLSKELLERYV